MASRTINFQPFTANSQLFCCFFLYFSYKLFAGSNFMRTFAAVIDEKITKRMIRQ